MLASQIGKSWRYPVTAMSPASKTTTTCLPSNNMPSNNFANATTCNAALGDDKVQPTIAEQLVGNERRPPLQQLQVPSAMSSTQQNTAVFSQMFSSCTIGNVHVYNFKPWQKNSVSFKLSVLSFTDNRNTAFCISFSCLMKHSALNYFFGAIKIV